MIDPRFVEAYEKHSADLIAYATAVAGPEEAEDVVAEVVLRVIRTTDWGRIVEPRGYLFRCVLNEARRRTGRRAVGRARELQAEVRRDQQPRPVVDELGVFRALSPRERAVVYLTYWEDASVAQVADVLDISNGAVRRYLARARAKLRTELGSD